MIHPHTELRYLGEDVGYGVVAVRPIPCGTVTWVMDRFDRTFSPAALARMSPAYQGVLDHYCYRNRKGDYVLCWDHARYINHSFRPNCMASAYNFELAVRDIAAGEELVNDYGFLNIMEPFRARDEGCRRKVVYPDDLKRNYRQWDRMLKAAFDRFAAVEQPLQPFFRAPQWSRAVAVAEGREKMESILNNACP